MALNNVTLMGRLTRDPEFRVTGTGVSVASFSIAVDRDYTPQGQEKQTDFIDCTAWRKTAEFVQKYFRKGSMIALSGRLEMRSWQDKETGKRRTAHEVNANSVYFAGSKPESDGSAFAPPAAVPARAENFAPITADDPNLPF